MMITNNHSLQMLLAGMLSDPSVLAELTVSGISLDSRDVVAGGLFLSLAKDAKQRENNLQQALAADISVVLFDAEQILTELENNLLSNVAAYPIRKLADKAGEMAARFYGHPSLALDIIAVTGTNGKTSVSQFIAQGLESLGHACGVIGTLGVGRITNLQYTGMTTPDPVSVQRTLAEFCQQDIKYAVIEASSHALSQGRLNSITIDVAALTNISRDHLDYHGDMNTYSAAKSQLFDFSSIKTAVLNSADSLGQKLMAVLAERAKVSTLTYSSREKASSIFQAENIQMTNDGLSFDLTHELGTANIQTKLVGSFNVDNLLATAACLMAVGMTFEQAVSAVKQCQSVDGRMQSYGGKQQAHIVVDFAHTPDALMQALTSLEAHIPANGDLWCVFGCGGDRDAGKRAVMGEVAEQFADKIIITDDNPRSEDSAAIVKDILAGMTHPEAVLLESDRKLAITHAITHAKSTDIVLIAGKGHEQYQEVKGVKYVFSDSQVVMDVLQAANDENSASIGETA